MLETLANLGEFIGAIGVIVSIGYLAIQIRQNTKAVRSSSYHQAAEQTWSACLTMADNPELAEIWMKAMAGEALTPLEQARLGAYDLAVLFGLENMVRLHEEGLLDHEVFENLIDNSLFTLVHPRVQALLEERPGGLSKKLARLARARAEEIGFEPDLTGLSPGATAQGSPGTSRAT